MQTDFTIYLTKEDVVAAIVHYISGSDKIPLGMVINPDTLSLCTNQHGGQDGCTIKLVTQS